MKIPKKGDKIYIPTSLHISSGSDDVQGGLATIDTIRIKEDFPDDHYNKIFVTIKEVPGHSYNYRYLLEEQDKLKEKFGDKAAYPDPDVDTPWIENGDIVNGQKWTGGNVW